MSETESLKTASTGEGRNKSIGNDQKSVDCLWVNCFRHGVKESHGSCRVCVRNRNCSDEKADAYVENLAGGGY